MDAHVAVMEFCSLYDAQRKSMTLVSYTGNEGPDQTAHAQSDQGLRCPLTKSRDTVDSTGNEGPNQNKRMTWSFGISV